MVVKIQEKAEMYSFVRTWSEQYHKNTFACVQGLLKCSTFFNLSTFFLITGISYVFVAQQTISPVMTNGTDCCVWCQNVITRFIKRLEVIECLIELQPKYHLLKDLNQWNVSKLL